MTLSNIISISRIVLAPIIALLIFQNMWISAVILLLIALATDILDGYVARRLKQVTKKGQVLDYLGDKILLFIVIFALLWVFGSFEKNWIFMLMFFTKDIINIISSLILRSIKSVHARPLGKAVMVLQAVTLLWFILQLPYFEFFIYAVFILGIIAGIDYFSYFKKKLKKRR